MIPARHLRIALEQYRKQGIPFEQAWICSIRGLPKPSQKDASGQMKEWIDMLTWAKPEFKAAYLDMPSPGVLRRLEVSSTVSEDTSLPLAA